MSDQPFPDPYHDVCIHGLWPLVADAEAPGGVRFAKLGQDRPEDCIVSPEVLPDAELTLKVFDSRQQRDAWATGVAEVAGNAIHVALSNISASPNLDMALLIRFDRSRAEAQTVDEAIKLVVGMDGRGFHNVTSNQPVTDIRPQAARARKYVLEAMHKAGDRQAWRQRWADVTSALYADKRLSPDSAFDPKPDDPLAFSARDIHGFMGMVKGQVEKVPGGNRVFLGFRGSQLPADLEERWSRVAGARSWASDGKSGIFRVFPVIDTAAVDAIVDAAENLSKERARFEDLFSVRRRVEAHAADPDQMAVLKRLLAGCPVTALRPREPGAQANPKTGNASVVAAKRIEMAASAGLIVPVWWQLNTRTPRGRDDGYGFVPEIDSMAQVVWGLTETGRALAKGDVEAAARTLVADERRIRCWHHARQPETEQDKLRPHHGLASLAAVIRPEGAGVPDAVIETRIKAFGDDWRPLRKFMFRGVGRHNQDLAEFAAMVVRGAYLVDETDENGMVNPDLRASPSAPKL